MNFKKTVPVTINADYNDDVPDYATISLDAAAIKRIKQLAKAVKDLKVTYIEEFDNTADLKCNGMGPRYSKWGGRSECNMLVVSDNDFHYSGIIKHTSVTWETEGIPLSALKS